ncbi:MAG TPA: MmcQ/YjbR family DNA-binding protein [Myxococcota bacterium]|nr:MmcQ/YjbR family DNA-binding protein [Myxococcota bacterium]
MSKRAARPRAAKRASRAKAPREPLARVRALCLALPEAREKITWDQPTFRVREKMFAVCGAGTGRLAVTVKAPQGAQEVLIAYDPRRYFVPHYVGKAGWVGVYLEGRVDWNQVAALIEQSYRLVAPKKLAAKLEAGASRE